MFEIFIYGVLIGYILNPFLSIAKAILINAFNATYTPGCTGDCNQGRNCTCKEKQNGI